MIGVMNWFNDDQNKIAWFNRWFSYKDYQSIEQLEALYIKFCGNLGLTCTKQSLELYMAEDMRIDMVKIKFNDVSLLKTSIDYTLPKPTEAVYDAVKRLMYSTFEIRMNKPRGLSFLADATIELRSWKRAKINDLVNTLRTNIVQEDNTEEQVDKFISSYNELNKSLTTDCLKAIDPLTASISLSDSDEESRILYKTGFKPVDDLYGGEVLTRQVIGIAAMPGAGKTRWLSRYFIYNAIMNKKNVLFDSLDEPAFRIWSYILCMYINDVYNIYIEPRYISTPAKLSDEQKNLVELSKKELRESGNFGKLIIRGDTTLTSLYNNGVNDLKKDNIDIYCIDFLGTIAGGDDIEFKRLDKNSLIARGMEVIKDITKKGDVLTVIIHQFTKEAEEAVNTGRRLPAEPVQGGTPARRYSDVLITMSGRPTIDKTIRVFEFLKARDNDYVKPYFSRVDLKNFIFTLKCDVDMDENKTQRKEGGLVQKFNALD